MKKPTTQEKIRALQLSMLVLSVGWDEALRIMRERSAVAGR